MTVKVFEPRPPDPAGLKQTISTVPPTQKDKTRVDEMALSADGKFLIAANNAEDPPFATLFVANGDAHTSAVTTIVRIEETHAIIPPGFGLTIEQPAWEPKTKRFHVSVQTIPDNPAGLNYGQRTRPVTRSGKPV